MEKQSNKNNQSNQDEQNYKQQFKNRGKYPFPKRINGSQYFKSYKQFCEAIGITPERKKEAKQKQLKEIEKFYQLKILSNKKIKATYINLLDIYNLPPDLSEAERKLKKEHKYTNINQLVALTEEEKHQLNKYRFINIFGNEIDILTRGFNISNNFFREINLYFLYLCSYELEKPHKYDYYNIILSKHGIHNLSQEGYDRVQQLIAKDALTFSELEKYYNIENDCYNISPQDYMNLSKENKNKIDNKKTPFTGAEYFLFLYNFIVNPLKNSIISKFNSLQKLGLIHIEEYYIMIKNSEECIESYSINDSIVAEAINPILQQYEILHYNQHFLFSKSKKERFISDVNQALSKIGFDSIKEIQYYISLATDVETNFLSFELQNFYDDCLELIQAKQEGNVNIEFTQIGLTNFFELQKYKRLYQLNYYYLLYEKAIKENKAKYISPKYKYLYEHKEELESDINLFCCYITSGGIVFYNKQDILEYNLRLDKFNNLTNLIINATDSNPLDPKIYEMYKQEYPKYVDNPIVDLENIIYYDADYEILFGFTDNEEGNNSKFYAYSQILDKYKQQIDFFNQFKEELQNKYKEDFTSEEDDFYFFLDELEF